jgi:hypothetical protein
MGSSLALNGVLSAQVAVPIDEEPRHRPMAEMESVQVLDIRIPPGDTTRFHHHDKAVVYVAYDRRSIRVQVLGDDWGEPNHEVGDSGDVTVDVDYVDSPVSHRVTNIGDRLFHLVAVLNTRAAGQRPVPDPGALPGELETDNDWLRVSRLGLVEGGGTEWATSNAPVVVTLSRVGRVRVDLEDGWSESLSRFGDFALVEPSVRFRLESPAPGGAEVVLVQVR